MSNHRTKQQRRDWFYSLTDEQREAWIKKKQAEKSKKCAGRPSNCTVFPVIDDSNRKEWQDRILRINPWLDVSIFERKTV